jgi:nucleotide-binding universal stress UspA family protein
MSKVIACVDGAPETLQVADHAVWAALKLEAPLEFLHVLDRHPERAPVTDFSGAIGVDSQESLMEELARVDEQRSALAQRHGRVVLDRLVERASGEGVAPTGSRQRHGSLLEAVVELEAQTRLVVLGRRQQFSSPGRLHLDHDVERIVRAVRKPVLVAGTPFRPMQHFTVAFDGSPTGRRMVETLARSPMLRGMRGDVLSVSPDTPAARTSLEWARSALADAGFEVSGALQQGEPETLVRERLQTTGSDLLVMGAYGHSRIREFIVGSTTTTLLRTSPVSVLVLR